MKYSMLYIVAVLLSFGSALPISAQAIAGANSGVSAKAEASSLYQLDTVITDLARSIRLELKKLPPDARIRVGGFYFNDADTDLGSYWTQQLSGTLAGGGSLKIVSHDADFRAEAAYVLRGSLLEVGNTLRIYTLLVKTADETLINSWNMDITVTDFIAGLIQISGSASTVRRDRYEPDSRENPLAVSVGGTEIARTIHDREDNDWFSITPDRAGSLIVETTGSMDTYMYLYDSGGSSSELRTNDDGGQNGNARIEWFVEEGKTYIARVKGYDSSEIGQYSFRATLEPMPEDTNEPNDTREEATLITSGSQIETVFGSPQDIDWYKVTIGPEDMQLSVWTEGHMDTTIEVYRGNERITENDDTGNDGNAAINIIASQGDYYIKVSELSRRPGRYVLRTRLQLAPIPDAYENDNSRATAKDIRIGDEVQERTFSGSDDIDWVRIVIAEAGTYEIRIQAADGELDSYMELYDADYEIIADDDDSGGHYNPRIRRSLEPGTYHLKIVCINGYLPEDNRYTLRITAGSN